MGIILAQGDFLPDETTAIEHAADCAGQQVHFQRSVEDACRALREEVPTAILTLGVGRESSLLTTAARTEMATRHVAVLSISEDLGSQAFSAAMSWGADDIVRRSEGLVGLLPRLQAAVRGRSRSFSPRRGTAVLAEATAARQVAFRRTLEGAGFAVRAVETSEQLEREITDLRVALWVISTNFHDSPEALIAKARAAGVMARVIIVADGQQFDRLEAQLDDDGCRLLRGVAPADHVVFLANEMSRPDLLNQRESPRALFSTTVLFSRADSSGTGDAEVGYSYNVSHSGVYIRTLAPPSEGPVRVELTPPGSPRVLSLSGEIAWTRPFGADGQATAPPGFGMKLVHPKEALEVWRRSLSGQG